MTDPSSPTALALTALADELLEAARAARSGRAVHPLSGTPQRPDAEAEHGSRRAHRGVLTQVVLALTEGSRLSDHENPGEATLQVLRGTARLSTAEQAFELHEGELTVIPQERHDLRALADAVVILTIARHTGDAEPADASEPADAAGRAEPADASGPADAAERTDGGDAA